MSKFINLTGHKFGKLTVMEVDGLATNKTYMWKCLCECGKEIITRGTILRNGTSKSCGCGNNEGLHHTRIFKIWQGIKQRCTNSNYDKYDNYGGRGISICNEWLDFMVFYRWSNENGYTNKLTIDRKNVNGNYEPSNCRWITNKEQQHNKRNNHIITFNNKTQTVTQWAEELGMVANTLITRILKYGWSTERALTTPVEKRTYKIK